VTWYHPVARSLKKAHIFLATHLLKGSPNRDQTEKQQIITMPAKQLLNELVQGKLRHAPTIIANVLLSDLTEGSHTIVVFATDIADNAGASNTVQFMRARHV
jgi:hypothetical protein